MRKLRIGMVIFCVLVSLPLAFVAWRTYTALDREAEAQVRFFADELLDEIEAGLRQRVRKEENRAVDEYRHRLVQDGRMVASPLAQLPEDSFILGYFQNNPDGSFQTPLVDPARQMPARLAERVTQLTAINTRFNDRKLTSQPPAAKPTPAPAKALQAKKEEGAFAGRFLKTTERKKSKVALGRKSSRVEEITADQAMNVIRPSNPAYKRPWEYEEELESKEQVNASSAYRMTPPPEDQAEKSAVRPAPAVIETANGKERFRAEVAPLQAVAIDADRVFIFRRIGINQKIYRQGFVLELAPFLDHLVQSYYAPQPLARYTRLVVRAAGHASRGEPQGGTEAASRGAWVANRTFPAPFGFLSAEMEVLFLPPSPARQTLTLALTVLGVVMAAGLALLYHSARTVMDLSERRSRFVSAVTHELKTPLTNIRMYIEMLDQGVAADREREQEYFDILSSESARLSGLINNVLELSRLEKKTRQFHLVEGDLGDVLADVQAVMAGSLDREGFVLTVTAQGLPPCAYDREVLVQVLINLMENSIKFGRHLPQKTIAITADSLDGRVRLQLADSGPGIPKEALKQVFDDFYRADTEQNRAAGGTGIGLALVKKFVLAMGGRVRAENNDGAGCTITIELPVSRQS